MLTLVDVDTCRPSLLTTTEREGIEVGSSVMRNIYAFEFELQRIELLVQGLRPCFEQVQAELLAFVDFLEQLAQEE